MSEEKSGTFATVGVIGCVIVGVVGLCGVGAIGVLAAIAIPAFTEYVKKSKTAEVGLNLKTIADGAATYYERDHYTDAGLPVSDKQFPTPSGKAIDKAAARLPVDIPRGTKELVPFDELAKEPWNALKFSVFKPVYYRYTYNAENTAGPGGDAFNARGEGDLDADDETSRFNVNGSTNASGEVLITPVFLSDVSSELE